MNFIPALVYISCFVVSVTSLRCYWCDSNHNQHCDKNFQPGSITIEDGCQYCSVYDFTNPDVIVRNCSKNGLEFKSGCKTEPSYGECACAEDLCNGARSEKVSLFGMTILTCLSMYSLYMLC